MAGDEADSSAPSTEPFWLLLRGSDVRPSVGRIGGRVVLLHGWLQEHSSWLKVATALRDRFAHDVLLLDFHGHGRSAGARGDVGSLDAAVAEAVRLVATDEHRARLPIALFGHSLGSLVTFIAAHRLATNPALPTPDMVVLAGFAMDSLSPPFGIKQLTPVLRALPTAIHAIVRVLAAAPYAPACELACDAARREEGARLHLVAGERLRLRLHVRDRWGNACEAEAVGMLTSQVEAAG